MGSRLLYTVGAKCRDVLIGLRLLGKRPLNTLTYPLQLSSVSSNHAAVYEESIKHPEQFWGDLARRRLKWFKEFDQVMDCDMAKGKISWFNGGKINVTGTYYAPMLLNVVYIFDDHLFVVNVLDRHTEKHPDKAAIIWEQDTLGSSQVITYRFVVQQDVHYMIIPYWRGPPKMWMPSPPLLRTLGYVPKTNLTH